MAQTRWIVGVGLAAALTLVGCLDYREQFTLNADGSGTLQVDFVIDLGLLDEVSRALGDKPDDDDGPTREEIMEGLQVEGIEIKSLTVQQRDRKSRVQAVIEFRDLKALGQIEGFGDDRKVEFFDNGDGKVRLVYSFDTRDALAVEMLSEDAPPEGEALDPVEKRILDLTRRARDEIRFRARVTLPGPILRSTGEPDPANSNVSQWTVDKQRDPRRHAAILRGKVVMQAIVERETVPFVAELRPLPAHLAGSMEGAEGRDPAGPPGPRRPGGLGD